MLSIDSELVRLLMRTGYLAAWNGFYKEAVSIFDGVAAVRPESEQPYIGGATVALLSGDAQLAATIVDRALVDHPDHPMLLAHKGCILRVLNHEEAGQALLQQVIDSAKDENAVQLASNVIGLETEAIKFNS